MEEIEHQGKATFNNDSDTYQVFRNVKDFGAKGDGVTDDTVAINRAMSEGGRCGPGKCNSTTTTPAVVYFPGGTYMLSSSIVNYYYTQIIGNPNCLPTLKAKANFKVGANDPMGLIDGSQYQPGGGRGYIPQNVFFRQVRNLVIDTTSVPANESVRGIHWPTSQTTSIQNVVFKLSAANNTQHEGLYLEEGSGGFMTDLVFHGGSKAMNVGNQQFTTRNLTFHNCKTAIHQNWSWGWTYKSVSINNCQVGINMTAPYAMPTNATTVAAGSVTLLDSSIRDTDIGILTARTPYSQPDSAGSLYLENVGIQNVGTIIKAGDYFTLKDPSGNMTIGAWADGHWYDHSREKNETRGYISPSSRPATLLDPQGKYYERSKPHYGDVPVLDVLSAKDLEVKGDGETDDTEALNAAIKSATDSKKILFIDAGYYKVTDTIFIPPGAKIVGEALASVIMSSGDRFNDINNPRPVVQVGEKGEHGSIEWSDMFVSTQGPQAGAILIEYNLYTTDSDPAGMWDVHTRIGGFKGSKLQSEQCPITPGVNPTAASIKMECVGAYMSMHVTKWASNLYMENNWFWVADHDLDDPLDSNTQITVYVGRGLLIEGLQGNFWLYGTAVEHHAKYQYQLVDTLNVYMGQIQTETAYYQPHPDPTLPFPTNPELSDPEPEPASSSGENSTNTDGWGLRILRSSHINIYGAGLYSFFDDYNNSCSQWDGGASCQTRILSIEGNKSSHHIHVYNLNTVGTGWMVSQDGEVFANNVDNNGTFVDTVVVLRV
ncbi:pectin lyase-like protein [Massarina eburnea CBS 473.64]|uniref:Pectin lyase-like protein n=1 Tax=Massarina eburnea CBS 473.64 TaxID=1395130 RepID=A0A6A6RY66_9PLEO|nr:pectin lyase-like protein [Massarina eburnea CBS 473.64]